MVSTPERTPEWNANVGTIRRLSAGAVGVGSRTEARVKVMGTTHRVEGVCTVYDRPRRLVIESRSDLGATTTSDMGLEPAPGGCVLRARLRYTVPGGGLGGLLDRLVLEKRSRQEFEESLSRLRLLAEEGE